MSCVESGFSGGPHLVQPILVVGNGVLGIPLFAIAKGTPLEPLG